jgi:DNA-binding response OmpR family regulator
MARILLIDDDEPVRQMLRATLTSAGHTVEEACDGKEGIARYHPDHTNLVITDLIMPEKDGLETIAELKWKYPSVKILAVSGGSRMCPADQLNVAKKMGADHILAKPFSTAKLLAIINELIDENKTLPNLNSAAS